MEAVVIIRQAEGIPGPSIPFSTCWSVFVRGWAADGRRENIG